jgi:hypothetical protein
MQGDFSGLSEPTSGPRFCVRGTELSPFAQQQFVCSLILQPPWPCSPAQSRNHHSDDDSGSSLSALQVSHAVCHPHVLLSQLGEDPGFGPESPAVRQGPMKDRNMEGGQCPAKVTPLRLLWKKDPDGDVVPKEQLWVGKGTQGKGTDFAKVRSPCQLMGGRRLRCPSPLHWGGGEAGRGQGPGQQPPW